MWVYLGLLSALLLGFYDLSKKHSAKENAVLPILFLSTFVGALMMLPTLLASTFFPDYMSSSSFYVPSITWNEHLKIFLKAGIASLAWVCSFFAIKHLPISIVSTFKASGPFFTMFGAVLLFQERPGVLQWVGIACILISFTFLSKVGKKEGIKFERNRWVLLIFISTLANACSGLYDKYLIQSVGITAQIVQTWFAVYLLLIQGAICLVFWYPTRKKTTPFQWRWSIPMIGVLLICADFFYFRALQYEDAMIVIVSSIRRGRVFIAMLLGAIIYKEINVKSKFIALSGVFCGMLLIVLAS